VDTVARQKFTGQERDTESGLDFFQARYYGGAHGRFLSPDEPLADQGASDPQSWNLYNYVRNNPLKYVDPSGYDCAYLNDNGDDIQEVDNNSNISECSDNGGYWVDGPVNSLAVGDDGSYQFGWFGDNGQGTFGVRAYDSYIGPGEGRGQLPDGSVATLSLAGQMASPVADPGVIAQWYGLSIISGTIGAAGYAVYTAGTGVTALAAETGAVATSAALLHKLNHIFANPGHNLRGLVQLYGSTRAAYDALLSATTQQVMAAGLTGQFQEVVNVGGTNVTVRGAVINGVVKIGTAFIP
jgi:RHS repeat-associated protein